MTYGNAWATAASWIGVQASERATTVAADTGMIPRRGMRGNACTQGEESSYTQPDLLAVEQAIRVQLGLP
jgi:hypothetical protein